METDQNKEKKLRILSNEEVDNILLEILRRHEGSLHWFAEGLCRSSGGIERDDLKQEFYLRVFKNRLSVLEAYEEDKIAYLKKIMRHALIDLIRKRKSLRNLSRTLSNLWANDNDRKVTYLGEFLIDDIAQFIAGNFSKKNETVLMMNLFEGYAYKEIADKIGLNVKTVATIIRRGRIRIQSYLRTMHN